MRISFERIYMDLALSLAQRSTCSRLHVGCVITASDYSQVYSIGYNGSGKGMLNGCDRDTPGDCGCLHAEDNALIKCSIPSYVQKILFCTHSPCDYCAKRILNHGGIEKVYYTQLYRSDKGVKILQDHGIQCELLS